ncbi:MAG TPA: hypothetical protein VIJ14_00125 [Rhabdochlamydiaceae bacterium]
MFESSYVAPSEFFDSTTKTLATGRAEFNIKKIKTHDENGKVLTNSKGAQSFQVVMSVKDSKGAQGTIVDYMHENFPSKVHELLAGVGLPHLYKPGFDPHSLLGNGGELVIGTRVTDKKPEGMICVDSYIPYKLQPNKAEESDLDQAIPF